MKNFILSVQRPILGLLVLGVSFVSSPVYAQACTPIVSVPTTITVPGIYCLTSDLVFSGYGIAINVQADDVTVDFKGHEIKGSITQNMIGIAAGSSSFAHTIIRNGRITNARTGVIIGRNGLVENMNIKDVILGVHVTGEFSIVRNNIITDVVPKYDMNSLGAAGIYIAATFVAGCGHVIENNKIRNFRKFQGSVNPQTSGYGIFLDGGCRVLIKNNFIDGTSVAGAGETIGIDVSAVDSLVIGNVFSGYLNKNLKCGYLTKYKDNISTSVLYGIGLDGCGANGDLGGNL